MPTRKMPKCEKCNSRMIAQIDQQRLWCQVCGHQITGAAALPYLSLMAEQTKSERFPHGFNPSSKRVGMDPAQEFMLDEAWEKLGQGDARTARVMADQLVSQNHRIIEGYYILYLSASSTLEKARHLASILALNPHHAQAKQALDKLKRVTGENIKPSFSTVFDHREFVDEEIAADARLEVCPMCGGQTLYQEADNVRCLSCNYTPGVNQKTRPLETPLHTQMPLNEGFHNLQEEFMQRKYGTGKQWIIAARVLACQNCGAQLTLSGSMMTDQCAFCDSQHILVQDVLGSFQEPDAVLPARLDQADAATTEIQGLPAHVQRRVYRQESVGVFLPYWSFRGRIWTETGYRFDEVLVPGGTEPNPRVLEDIQPFDLRSLRPYDQRYLANWSAGLYGIDAIQASLQVNTKSPEALQFRLVLLPVWMTTLHLRGGGYYHSVINAQTGEVVISERVDSKGGYQSRRQAMLSNNQAAESPIRPLS